MNPRQEEIDAQLIAQLLEEDESRMLAESLQNEMYGGQPGAQQRDFPMQAQNVNARGNPVRAA